MGQITGRAKVSATATVSPITVGQNNRQAPHTLINEGAGLVGYRYQPGGASISGLADEAALRAAGAAILAAGESVVLPASTPYVELACPTGVTATVRIEPGEHQATLAAIAGGVGVIDLSATDKSYTHTTAGTAEEVTGLTAGDVYVVDCLTAGIALGSSKALAEAAVDVQGPLRVAVPAGATSFWIDCTNSSTAVLVRKVS